MRMVLAALILCLAACGDGRFAYVVDADGELRQQTPEVMREQDERRLAALLSRRLEGLSEVVVDIVGLPQAQRDEASGVLEWRYAQSLAQVVLVTTLSDEALLAEAQSLSERFLRDRRLNFSATYAAEVSRREPGERPPGQDYTIQHGDTLARISSVFYGSADHWRLIERANPGLDPANLKVGSVIRIPDRD
ncbi:MAG: LysM peptidoglycan-binding domain-containing protein [Planctomycetota bacterium]|nr:MAG: LysM peptidoglycan-binding domain-containing protein [Planctomycetota bacterium]